MTSSFILDDANALKCELACEVAAAALCRHLAPFRPAERRALHPHEGPDHLHLVHSRFELHALSRSRLHGRKRARPLDAGLRKVFRQNRSPVGQYAAKEERRSKLAAVESNSDSSAPHLCWYFCVRRDSLIGTRSKGSNQKHARPWRHVRRGVVHTSRCMF